MPDMLMSSSTTSNGVVQTNTNACSPHDASEVRNPRLCRVVLSARRTEGSSSTIRMLPCDEATEGCEEERCITLLFEKSAPQPFSERFPSLLPKRTRRDLWKPEKLI